MYPQTYVPGIVTITNSFSLTYRIVALKLCFLSGEFLLDLPQVDVDFLAVELRFVLALLNLRQVGRRRCFRITQLGDFV